MHMIKLSDTIVLIQLTLLHMIEDFRPGLLAN